MNENFILNLPGKFRRNTLDLSGEHGEKWLNDLPQIIAELSKNWSIEIEKSFPNLSYNFVAPCFCSDGAEAVLKIALPLNNPEIFNEANFLRITGGNGAVKLLKSDENHRALLLEKLSPGTNLKESFGGDESKTVEIAINILRDIKREPPLNMPFRHLDEWFTDFLVKVPDTNFPPDFVSQAREFFEELSTAPKFLIHGDLHHENILSATREPFLAIDPKGIVGNIGYEIAVFLNNHLWWLASDTNLREKLNAAVIQFSEACEIAPKDLRKWSYAQMVLSAWWTFEENGDTWKQDLVFAEFWKTF